MKITRSDDLPTTNGPANWFTGDVHMDTVNPPGGNPRLAVTHVHFAPGARTAWHRHPNGQTLHITHGIGRVGSRGSPPDKVHAGDCVVFDAGEEHWHGAAPDRRMSHLSLVEPDEHGQSAVWLEKVTDQEYGAG